ncbi:MAG: flap endonuclease-1, partial [Candidatus Bathyarchaeia archaeon]
MYSVGVSLAPIIVKAVVSLEALEGKSFATDGNNALHQFLALIRLSDGSPLTDQEGHVTSHLVGLMFRTTHLMEAYDIRQVFVFDGRPSELKRREIEERKAQRQRSLREMREAQEQGDYAKAFRKAVRSGSLTRGMLQDAKRLLTLLGVPHFDAPGEAEAQAAHMAAKGDVWAADSRDFDSLLFGAPRLVRYLTISGKEFLPSKGVARLLKPEVIELDNLLRHHGITREQLVDLAVLIGTDFNAGVKGVGPKGALKLIKAYGRLEDLPAEVQSKLPEDYEAVREVFLHPSVTDEYPLEFKEPDG